MWLLIASIAVVGLLIVLAPRIPWPKEPVTEDEVAEERAWGRLDAVVQTVAGFFRR